MMVTMMVLVWGDGCSVAFLLPTLTKSNEHNDANAEGLIIRIGFWGPLYYNSNKELPK